jgi:hypothetical protein
VQLQDQFPITALIENQTPPNWKEPEAHLDSLVESLLNLPGISRSSNICGVTPKDASVLKRLNACGINNTWIIDPKNDLGILEINNCLAAIQGNIDPDVVPLLRAKYGTPDLIISRHAIEHSYNIFNFLSAIKSLVHDSGYIVLEVPDSYKALTNFDYSSIWEQHTFYFTKRTFERVLISSGLSIIDAQIYSYPYEDCLVSIVKKRSHNPTQTQLYSLDQDELSIGSNFGIAYPSKKEQTSSKLRTLSTSSSIAVYGSGHTAVAFINLLNLHPHLQFVVDDNLQKRGRYMPGSDLPIFDSASLTSTDVGICLSSVNIENRDRMIKNNRDFVNKGGSFYSIFPETPETILNKINPPHSVLTLPLT